jgi:hypothetical protein
MTSFRILITIKKFVLIGRLEDWFGESASLSLIFRLLLAAFGMRTYAVYS